MKTGMTLFALVTASVMLLASPALAQSEVLLGFGDRYSTSGDQSRVHHGVDVAAQGGEEVRALASGRVSFAGRVPAGGGTVLAMSLETQQGVVTLMPLERVTVREGDDVAVGQKVGLLAATGDASSDRTHLHVGLKRDGLYLDPSHLLTALVPAPDAPEQSPVPAATEVEHTPAAAQPGAEPGDQPSAASPGLSTSDVELSASAPAGHLSPAMTGEGLPNQSAFLPDMATGGSGAVASDRGGSSPAEAKPTPGALASGVTLSPPAARRREDVQPEQAPVAAAKVTPASRPNDAPHVARARVLRGLVILCVSTFAAVALALRQAMARRVGAGGFVSDRLGIMLQHLKAGDTLRGLTSCSGPLPSQSRGH